MNKDAVLETKGKEGDVVQNNKDPRTSNQFYLLYIGQYHKSQLRLKTLYNLNRKPLP